MDWNIPLDDERTLSVEQFCKAEGLLRYEYYDLRWNGCAPNELVLRSIELDGAVSDIVRITPEARVAWHRSARNLMKQHYGVGRRVIFDVVNRNIRQESSHADGLTPSSDEAQSQHS